MTLEIAFELDDGDLARFRELFSEGSEKAAGMKAEEIVRDARKLVEGKFLSEAPSFVRQRLEALAALIGMVEDEAWQLPQAERDQVLGALGYFIKAKDIIDDSTPVLGLLDDAIAAEIVLRGLQHEIDAYRDFKEFRDAESARRIRSGLSGDISKEDWLADRRATLHGRMRDRRSADSQGWHTFTLFDI